MEDKSLRWMAVTAVAPITWGASYFVTRHLLPADAPLWGSALRALPAGLLLLLVARRLPRGSWWWRAGVLGMLNMGAFFVLVYVAAQLLPTSVAATVMATSPLVMMLFAWALLAQRPAAPAVAGGVLGLVGVAAMVLTGTGALDARGLLASVAAMLMSSVGYVLAQRWRDPAVDVVSSTAWQLVAGGLVLLVAAVAVEGGPPSLDGPAWAGLAFLSLVATAVAYLAWFGGLRHLPAGTVGLVGLLNPVTGLALGLLVGGERLTPLQAGGVLVVLVGVALGHPALAARRRPAAPVPAPAVVGVGVSGS
ncbi:DMT family transporter [Cellulomonas composti]|uniref:ABC transporter permease n=1 Tax=Cellulomonas composti TaxID=266130 RepID=A0A511J9A0_9CELL|nr:DMT family transporter [Cellulomonas composti]GEL94564.1 ABC transporter permease [Cellulomonas composti]